MPKYRRFEKMLREREAYLARTLDRVERELVEPASKDDEERAIEREGDEVLEDLGQSARTELRMIDAALARIEEGEYGYCTICGDEISADRLDLLPATPFCANCAP